MKNFTLSILTLAATLLVTACATQKISIDSGPNAKLSSDGLSFVNNTLMDEVWFQPSVDMSVYSKLLVVNAGIHFKENSNFDNEDIEEQRSKFAKIATEAFKRELLKLDNFEIVEEAGIDVLLLHVAITNIELVKESDKLGRSKTYARNLGTADLIIDLRDSLTGEPIVLARDNRAINKKGREFSLVSEANTWQSVRELTIEWGHLLRSRLDLLSSYSLSSI